MFLLQGMKRISKILILIIISLLFQDFGFKRTDYRKGMYRNVCKDLSGNALIYVIFVDSKETVKWTEFDIKSTLDSLEQTVRWLNEQASLNGISLNIKTDFYIGEYTTIKRSMPEGSVKNSVTEPNLKKGIQEMNNWADNIAKKAGASFRIVEKDGIPEVQNPRNKERVIAHLRDENNVESVALLFMVNNYYKKDISIALNTFATEEIEYAVVSYKYPSEIAHNILRLYGAAELYPTVFRKNTKKIEMAREWFPDDIMQDPYAKNIDELQIGDLTKYLIGWTNTIQSKYEILLTD